MDRFEQMSDFPVAFNSAYNIMTIYGISHTDSINSCWYVVDAMNKHPPFVIWYPTDNDKQQFIAAELSKVSSAGFGCCARAIDGIFV